MTTVNNQPHIYALSLPDYLVFSLIILAFIIFFFVIHNLSDND